MAGDGVITIRHDHEDGTLVYGSSKGDGVYELIGPRTAARFRYFPSIRQIGIQASRDRPAKRWQIESAAEALRGAGFEVEIEIDDTPRDRKQVQADREERLDARYERLSARAARAQAEGNARSEAAHAISERFAGGQPILVGHHSERRARKDHDRMDGHMRAATTAWKDAERASQAASVVGDQEKYRQRPGVIRRRIDKTEAELRGIGRDLRGRPEYYRDDDGALRARLVKPGAKWQAQLEARKAWLEHQLADDRDRLEELQEAGYTLIDRSTVHKGDRVTSSRWWDRVPMEVTRVNPKSVTVASPPSDWAPTRKINYDEIKTVRCPHEQRTISANAPPVQWGREAPELERGEHAEVPEILAVGAGTECFVSPPAVVERVIEEAGLERGMTVLEPSAGTGAIAKRAAGEGATVDVIELEYSLFKVLDGAGGPYRSVNHGDFLEADPADQPYPGGGYDRVLMNPPFGKGADVRHVMHALRFVAPGGLVVAVMSGGVEFRSDKATVAFRELVEARGGSIERLPDDAFEPSGTSIRTVLAVIPGEAANPLAGLIDAFDTERERIERGGGSAG